MKRIKRIITVILCAWIVVCILVIIDNNRIQTSFFEYNNEKIPADFDGYKVVQVSDLHNKWFGKNQIRLMKKIESCKPDIIVFTGDMVSRKATKLENAQNFIKNAVKLCPVYYVEGNHEKYSFYYNVYFKPFLEGIGVHTLRNKSEKIYVGNSSITISGLRDPVYSTEYVSDINSRSEVFVSWINGIINDTNDFNILLSHRPEYFEQYCESGADLILTGHTHGGQVILPFIGGLYAPNQGMFPKYDKGIFTIGNSTMIISRGLGNSIMFPRLNNCPEIVCINLKSEQNS